MKRISVAAAAAVVAVATVIFASGGAQAATLFNDTFEDGNSAG